MEELLKEIKEHQLKFAREFEQMKRIQDMMFVMICGKKAKELQLYKRYVEVVASDQLVPKEPELSGFDEDKSQ